jgi:hypothetical protein
MIRVTRIRKTCWAISRNERLRSLLAWLLVSTMTLTIYGPALRLGFFFDDMVHFRWLDAQSLSSIWTSAQGLGYYRPLPFLVWKVSHLVLGHYDAVWLHVVGIGLHTANGVLLYHLIYGLSESPRRWFHSLGAALLFASYPFHYQAVPFVGALCHPLSTFLIMSSIILYLQSRIRLSKPLLVCSFSAAVIAPFAHETGVLLGLFIATVEAMALRRKRIRSLSRWPLAYLAIGLSFMAIWLAIPKSGIPPRWPSAENLWQNGVYFAQGLSFPTAPLAKTVMGTLHWSDMDAVALVSGLSLVMVLIHFKGCNHLVLGIGALLWFVISVLPAWLLLPFSYVIDGPRLLYLASAGAALLWAHFAATLSSDRILRRAGLLLPAVALVGMVWMNVNFVRSRMTLYAVGNEVLAQACETARASAPSESLLYVNTPSWLAYRDSTYALGHEGVTFLPGYAGLLDFVYVNTGLERMVEGVTFANVEKEWKHHIGHYDPQVGWEELGLAIHRANRVYLTDHLPDRLRLLEAGGVVPSSTPGKGTSLAVFESAIALRRGNFQVTSHELEVTLWWEHLRPVPESYTVFVHVYDEQGRLIAQRDGYPLLGMFPFWLWRDGDLVRDVRRIAMPEVLQQGPFVVAIGLYDTTTDSRVGAFSADGERYPNDSVPVVTFAYEE